MVTTDFRVGEWVVWPQRCCVERQGETIHVKPKSMAVLQCLAEAEGQVVSRNDLLDKVWPGAAVTDDVLTQCIVELRKAFGDSPQDPKVIETIPKKGLRLVPEIGTVDSRTVAPKGILIAAIALVATIIAVAGVWSWTRVPEPPGADIKTIAVLAFVDPSPEGDQEYFADGLSEELIARLTRLKGLQVTGSVSSFYFKNQDEDVQTIGKRLSASHILGGSVRRIDDKIKVIARLTDSSSGSHIWSNTYERRIGDVFEIQDEIAGAVATALSVGLGVGDFAGTEGGTSDFDAYDAFLAGNAALGESELSQAIDHFERATELDPGFARAWAELAITYQLQFWLVGQTEQVPYLQWRDEAIAEAVRHAPNAREVRTTQAQVHIHRNDLQQARRVFDDLHRGDAPGAPRYSLPYVDLLVKTGDIRDALHVARRISQRDPLNPRLQVYLAHALMLQGRFDRAIEVIEQGYELAYLQGYYAVEGALIGKAMNRPDEIRKWLMRATADAPKHPANVHQAMLEHLGNADRALDWLRWAYDTSSGYDYHVVNWASYYGDDALALRAMRRSRDLWGFWMPLTERIRRTDEFKSILRDAGLVDYFREYGWNDYCAPTEGEDFECQ